MKDVKTFADLFKGVLVDWDKMGKGKLTTARTDVGEMVVGQLGKTMGLESIEGNVDVGTGLGEYLMAVESAQADLARLNGISYSVALKHKDVLGIPVTLDNFNTQVSKKNYDMACENLKAFALIGLSAIIVAGFGFIVFKLMTANKKKSNSAKEIIKANKEIEKASKLFSSVDLSEMPEEQRQEIIAGMQNTINGMVKGMVGPSDYLTNGFAIAVASAAYTAEINTLEAYRFGATKESWLIETYLKGADEMNDHIKVLLKLVDGLDKSNHEELAVKAADLDKKLAETELMVRQGLGTWATHNGGVSDINNETFIQEVLDSANAPTRMLPDELIKRVSQETIVPDDKLYERFNKVLDESTKLGKQLDDALKNMPKSVDNESADLLLETVVENFKTVVSDMDDLAYVVRSEAIALGNIYGYRIAGAKAYGRLVAATLDKLEDKDLAKKIMGQLDKAIKELPNRRIALEDNDGEVAGMGLEGWAETATLVMAAGTLLIVGGSLFAMYKIMSSGKGKGDKAIAALEKLADRDNLSDEQIKEKILTGEREIEQGIIDVFNGRDIPVSAHVTIGTAISDINAIHDAMKDIMEVGDRALTKFKSTGEVASDNGSYTDKFRMFHTGDQMRPLENIMRGTTIEADITSLSVRAAALKMNGVKEENIDEMRSLVDELRELRQGYLAGRNTLVSPKDAAAKINTSKVDAKALTDGTMEMIEGEKKLSEGYTEATAKIAKYKVDDDHVKEIFKADPWAKRNIAYIRVYSDFISEIGTFIKKAVDASIAQRLKALHLMKDTGGKSMATESIEWEGSGAFQGSGDGLAVVLREAEEYLSLPEYSQAGYRFDPRVGMEGGNVMAMESWSAGAKIAVGIAAAVGLLGIGALIASTIIKRSSGSSENHATKDQIEQAKKAWTRIEGESGSIIEELRDLESQLNANTEYTSSHPQWRDQYQALRARVEAANQEMVEVDGAQVRIGEAIVKDLGGDIALMRAAKFGEFARHRPPMSALDVEDGKYPRTLKQLFDNVIEKPIAALEAGRPADAVLEDLNKYLSSKGNQLRASIMDGEYNTPEMQIAQVDGNWQPKAEYNANSTEIVTKPTEFLSMALGGHNMLLDLNNRIAKELGEYTIDDRLLARFNRVQGESQGNRDAAASILRRIEEFKVPFANFVRVLRRDQENIEKYLSFVDDYIKSMSKYGKKSLEDLAEIRRQMAVFAADATPQ